MASNLSIPQDVMRERLTMTDWQELLEFMHDPKTQEVVARYEPEPEAEEPQQSALWDEEAA